MQNYKVSIAYDGSSFYGFQKQKNRPTVQGKIEEVLDLLIKDYDLNYSGRTDAGVHAKEQILNILTDTKITEKLISSIDKLLGNKISVNSFNQISYDFHARYSAKQRTYVYSTMDNQKKLPFLLNNTYQHNSSLDLKKLNEISQVFLGKNDFSSFAKVEKNTNPKREIFKSVWKRNSGIFIYTITGNSFLRNMVRNLVGVQLAFNDNKLTLKEIKSQLDKPDGNRLNYIAPANGLTLWKVKY